MIKVGDKVRYISSSWGDDNFDKDCLEFDNIFTVLAVRPESSYDGILIYTNSKYNFDRTDDNSENITGKYWRLNIDRFEKAYQFTFEIDDLLEII